MDVKKILLITLIALAVVASVTAVSAGLFDGLFGEEKKDNVIEIDHIKFNTTNVTEFKLINETEDDDKGYGKWYMDKNDTGYNVHILNFSKGFDEVDESYWTDVLNEFKKDNIDNVPSQTVNGVVVYTVSANSGDHVGEPRYLAYIENRNAHTIVEFCTPDANETAKMALSIKFDEK